MSKVSYSKPALTYAAQLQQLKTRGLIIEDENKALHLLGVISYYRLSGYWYPMLIDKQNHQFKSDSSFETAFNIYKKHEETLSKLDAEYTRSDEEFINCYKQSPL